MQQLELVKADLERKLSVINEALKIQAEMAKEGGKTIPDKPDAVPDKKAFLKTEHIEKAILKINREFTSSDVPAAVEAAFPGDNFLAKSLIPNTLYRLIKENKLRYVSERQGQKRAIYIKTNFTN